MNLKSLKIGRDLIIITIVALLFVILPFIAIGQENRPPVAHFTFSPSIPHIGEKIIFNASMSYDPDGSIAQYEWDFNEDGIIDASGVKVSYRFPKKGQYNVKLIVVDDQGLATFIVKSVNVESAMTFDFSDDRFLGIGLVYIIPVFRLWLNRTLALESTFYIGPYKRDKILAYYLGGIFRMKNGKNIDFYTGGRLIYLHRTGAFWCCYDDLYCEECGLWRCTSIGYLISVGMELSWSKHWSIDAEVGLGGYGEGCYEYDMPGYGDYDYVSHEPVPIPLVGLYYYF